VARPSSDRRQRSHQLPGLGADKGRRGRDQSGHGQWVDLYHAGGDGLRQGTGLSGLPRGQTVPQVRRTSYS